MEIELEGYPKDIAAFAQSVFSGGAWHGASLMGTLRKISAEQARWENAEGYSPWKVVLHCAYWKHRAASRIAPKGTAGKFPRGPADFPALPDPADEAAWKADLAFVEGVHGLFMKAVAAQPWDRLAGQVREKAIRQILGAAAHDAYHTGMIRNLGVPGL